jgi:putative ABC transport system permease protein
METLWQDVKFGARMLAKGRGFTVVALLTLALGIGANSAIFSFVNAILLRPLPYPDADRLVFLTEWSEQVPEMSFSLANFADLRDQNRVFDAVVAFRGQNYVLTGGPEPERLNGRQVTAGLFPTLGITPVLGRAFTPEEDRPGGDRVVLLSDGLWTRRFGRDPSVLGRSLVLNDEPYTVVGVMPGKLHGSWRQSDVWTSLGRLEDTLGGPKERGNHPGVYVIGRMKGGTTLAQARAEVEGIGRRLAEEYPASNARQSMTVQPALDALVGDLKPALLILLGAVAFVLLIACANVSNLLLARAQTRHKEIAVRTALGAGRGRVIRQLLVESLLLSLAGGALGLALAFAGVRGLIALSPASTPRIEDVGVDASVLVFTLAVSLATGVVFGLLPALQTARADTAEALKEGGRSSSAPGRHRVRALLVVSEVSLALVLLVGAGLLLKSFWRLLAADPGFDAERVTTMTVNLPGARFDDPAKSRRFFDRVRDEMRAVPGVESFATTAPLLGHWQTSFTVEGRPEPPPGQRPSTDITRVSPEYFRTMGVRLLAGRTFTEQDREDKPSVCVIDETMAKAQWPGEDPLGKRLRLGGGGHGPENPWMTVVGIVGHVKNYGVDQESRVETYVPAAQMPVGFGVIVVRTAGDPGSVTAGIRRAVEAVDKDVPVFAVRPLADIVADGRAEKRLAAQLLGAFAALALVLAAIGIYGVMSQSVNQQTVDIGIRVALGARRADILKLVVGQGMALAGIGVGLGLLLALSLAFGLASALHAVLFHVSRTDPPTYTLVPLLLTTVALLACYLPARRALRVDPIRALRSE